MIKLPAKALYIPIAATIILLATIVLVRAQNTNNHASSAGQLSVHAHTHADGAVQLPVSIDGANTPELVPDDLAYRHFILSVAEHTVASSDDLKRRSSRLRMTGLSQNDQSALILALTNVREQLDAIEASRETTLSTDTSALQQLLSQERSILDNANAAIHGALSAGGATLLDNFIRNTVKKGITIYASN